MKEATERELSYYRAEDGDVPVQKWLSRLRDRKVVIEVDKRLRRVSLGNLGDHGKVGDKSSQSKDIELAKAYWADWKERET